MMIENSCRKIKTETTLFSRYRSSSIKTLPILTALFCAMPLAFAAQEDNLSKIHQQIQQQKQKRRFFLAIVHLPSKHCQY